MSVSDTLRAVFIGISRAFAFARVTLTNLLVVAIPALGIGLLFAGEDPAEVPDGSALVVAPISTIVEQTAVSPTDAPIPDRLFR